METPRISVLIAAKDYGRFLPQAIESVLRQTLDRSQFELIVVDDGSTDDTAEVVRRYAGRLLYLYQENRGQAAALNTGFRLARGAFIALLDADDYFYETKLAAVLARFEADPKIGMVHHRLDVVEEDGRLRHNAPFRRKLDEGWLRDQLIRYGGTWNAFVSAATSALAFRRSAVDAILPIPEKDFRTMADGYLVTQMALDHPLGAIHQSLGAYRMHGTNNWAPTALTSEWIRTRFLAPLGRVSDLVGARVSEEARKEESRCRLQSAPFPLTPALSLGERENPSPRVPRSRPTRTDPLPASPPLPKGEGWGEGEAGEHHGLVTFPLNQVRVTDDRVYMEFCCLAEKMDGNRRRAAQSYRLLVSALCRDRRISVGEKIWRLLSVFALLALPAASYTRLRQWYARNNPIYALRKKIFAPKEGALAHGSV